jgi:hypothetical protein
VSFTAAIEERIESAFTFLSDLVTGDLEESLKLDSGGRTRPRGLMKAPHGNVEPRGTANVTSAI